MINAIRILAVLLAISFIAVFIVPEVNNVIGLIWSAMRLIISVILGLLLISYSRKIKSPQRIHISYLVVGILLVIVDPLLVLAEYIRVNKGVELLPNYPYAFIVIIIYFVSIFFALRVNKKYLQN